MSSPLSLVPGALLMDDHRSVLDFNPMNTIASHMSYWADEDVSHFFMSQLLSNKSRDKRS
jgi:hypothetical protein